jgi:hypothetical protein
MVTSECFDSLSWQPANVMFDCHGNRRMLYQKRIADTKFDIYIFVHHYCSGETKKKKKKKTHKNYKEIKKKQNKSH